MLLKQPLIGACPARCATAVMPALDAVGDGHGIDIAVQKFGDQVDDATLVEHDGERSPR